MPAVCESSRDDQRRRDGFTLPEVLVAILAAAMVTLVVHDVAREVGAVGERLTVHGQEVDRVVNGERLLRQLVGGLDVSADVASFAGGPHEFTFRARCDTPAGWPEPCAVRVVLERADTVHALRVELVDGQRVQVVQLGRVAPGAAFRFLTDAADGGRWTTTWSSQTAIPLGVEVPFDDGTVFLRIGERG